MTMQHLTRRMTVDTPNMPNGQQAALQCMMSSQTVQESGDTTKEKVLQEVEKVTRLQNPQIPIQPRTKVNITQRPIAPAPGPVHSALSGAGSITAPKAHIISKVPQGLMGNTIDQQTGNTGAAQAPLILKTDPALSNTQTTSIPTVPIPTPVNIQAQGLSSSVALGQPQIPMASLIKSTTPQQPPQGGGITQVSVTQASLPYHQSHIPKGPALAANIASPKGGSIATAVIPRLAQPGVLQQTSLSGLKQHTVPTPNIHQVIMPNRMRSGTPPTGAPRSTSPHVTVAAAPPCGILGNETQRTLTSAGPTGTIQIMPAGVRATLGQSQKQVQIPQPVLQPQKVVMTQTAVSQMVTTGVQGPTLDIKNTATSALPRTQKIVISQQTTQSLASAQPTSKVTQALNLSQQTLQKGTHTQILVSQPQGGIHTPGNTPTVQTPVMNISQAINQHNKPHQILVSQPSTAKTGYTVNQPVQRPQQIVMTSATLQGHTSIVSTKPTSAALNLSQAKPKQVLMTQIPGHPGATVGPISKTGTPVSTAISSAVSMASATALSNTIASTLTSPPVAKVAPQRQLPSPQQNPELQRESFGMQALQQSNVLFHQPGNRGSPQPAMTASLPASHTDARPIERSNLSQGFNIPAPQQELLFYNLPIGGQMQPFNTGSFRPSFANQTPNLASTLQAAAQGGTGVRPNLINIVDPRHPMTPFGQTHLSEAVHGGSGDPGAASIFSTNVSQPMGVAPSPAVTNASASPRPSILRKRPHEGITVVKRNLMAGSETSNSPMQDLHPPAAISPKSNIPCDPSRENSQSSTDTATSNESTPQGNKTPELKIKQEPIEGLENGPPLHAGLTPSVLANNVESSPRKKPRKQLLNATEELKDGNSSTDEDIERFPASFDLKKDPEEPEFKKDFVDEEGVHWVAEKKRPNISLLNHYQCAWKAKNNHFQRYTDVKPKEERRPTVNELANQKGLTQKSSGWKLYHLAAQLEEMMDMEKDVFSKISSVQESIAPKHIAKHTIEDDIGMVHELTQGNIQRCQLFIDQLEEAKTSMLKITDHKLRINEIILKHHSKRPVKKKERT